MEGYWASPSWCLKLTSPLILPPPCSVRVPPPLSMRRLPPHSSKKASAYYTWGTHTHTYAACVFVAGGCDGSIWSWFVSSLLWLAGWSVFWWRVYICGPNFVTLWGWCVFSTLHCVVWRSKCATGVSLSSVLSTYDQFKEPVKWAFTSWKTLSLQLWPHAALVDVTKRFNQ